MKLHFMKYRKLSYWISGILVAISIVSLAVRGLNYGIDFAGGISMEVTPVAADYTIVGGLLPGSDSWTKNRG